MEIAIKLAKHCIKTGAKRKYDKLISRYFNDISLSNQEKMLIEGQIAALKFFLENANFNQLRGVYPELSGLDELSIRLVIPENNREIEIAYDDRIIKPEWRRSNE